MKKIIINLLYKLLNILNILSNNKIFYAIFEKFENNAYQKVNISNNEIKFFVPNKITYWRVKSLYKEEPDTINWINNFKGNNIIFWDIGANIGIYSIYAAKVHKKIDIVSFEPSTSNLRVLSRNISINNLENQIKINQCALTDKKNVFEIFKETEFKEGYSMNSFGYDTDFEGKKIRPKQNYKLFGTSIDYIIENKILDMPNYLKIDVDGIEHKILVGASKLLSSNKVESVLIEINENYLEQLEAVSDIMKKNNFSLQSKSRLGDGSSKKFIKTYNYIFKKNYEN